METVARYMIILAISYLGLIAGLIISFFSVEELSKGRKYFTMLKAAFFFGIASIFFFSILKNMPLSLIVSGITAFVTYFYEEKINNPITGLFYYSFFAIVLFEEMSEPTCPIIATMVFAFGIAESSIWKARKTHRNDIFRFALLDSTMLLMGFILTTLF